jgi:predicted nucleic acid-binding protein
VKAYVDSNIFLNVWFEEMIRINPVFYYSNRFLNEVINCKHEIVISDLTIHELSLKTKMEEKEILNEYLKEFIILNKIEILKTTSDNKKKAGELRKNTRIHLKDALHTVIAMQEKCVIITRDKDFQKVKDKIKIFKPEEI